jgi:hypothetical protein
MGIRDKIATLVRNIDHLDGMARRAMAPKPTMTKRVPLFESVAFVIPLPSGAPIPDSFNTLEQWWTNGADDAYITEVCHSSFGIRGTGVSSESGPRVLYDSDQGLLAYNSFDAPAGTFQGSPIFDFAWNVRMGVSGQLYGNSATGERYLSRSSLGNKYQDQPLRFTDPLFVKAGDTLIWMLKPLMYNPGAVGIAPPDIGGAPFTAVVVNMLMWGYRDGTMAVPEFGLKPADMSVLTDTER